MLEPYRTLLTQLRSEPETWSAVAYVETHHEDGATYDTNAAQRYGILVCLQDDWTSEDEDLIRYLFDQEVTSARSTGSDDEPLRLAANLLARFRRPDNVWRFWAAKTASFDTWCGFDNEYLFASGAADTLQVIQNTDHPQREQLLAFIAEWALPPTAEQLAAWWQVTIEDYPENDDEISLLGLIERALRLEAWEEGQVYLERWANNVSVDHYWLSKLMWYREQFGQFDLALTVAKQRVLLVKDEPRVHASALASALDDVLRYAIKAAAYTEAVQVFQEASVLMQQHPGWKEIGLTRMILEHGLDLALALPPDSRNLQKNLLLRIDALLRQGVRPSLALLKKSLGLAELAGDQHIARRYRRRIQDQTRRSKAAEEQ